MGEDEQPGCAEPCAGGCDRACERRVTWKPDPARAFLSHGPGYVYEADGSGGGVLKKRSKVTLKWREVSRATPYGA